MRNRGLKPPAQNKRTPLSLKIKVLFFIALIIAVMFSFAKKIEIKSFLYDDNLIGLEPIFTQKVKIISLDKDSTGQLFINIADGSRIKFLGIEILYPDEAIRFLEKNMADTMVYLSYEGKEEDNAGFKNAYVWSDEVYEYYNVSVLWNAVLIINGFALPLDFDYTYNEIFFALESQELEMVKTEVEGVKTTQEIKKSMGDTIPPGFEALKWDMMKPEVWYKMNEQLIEERDNKLVYITRLYNESCLLTFIFDDDASMKSVSYIFSFVDVNHAEASFERFINYLNKIISENAIEDLRDFQRLDDNKIEAYCLWVGSNAKVELLMKTVRR